MIKFYCGTPMKNWPLPRENNNIIYDNNDNDTCNYKKTNTSHNIDMNNDNL